MRDERKFQFIWVSILLITSLFCLSAVSTGCKKQPANTVKVTNPLLLRFQEITTPLPERKLKKFYTEYIKNEDIVTEIYKYKGKIDLDLLTALMFKESSFNLMAKNVNRTLKGKIVSSDHGLMQLNTAAFPTYTGKELSQLDLNVKLGVEKLLSDISFFEGNIEKGLQAYNAGRRKVVQKRVPFASVKYAKEVIEKAVEIKKEKAIYLTQTF